MDAVAEVVDPRACKSLLLMSVGVNIFNIVKHSANKIHKLQAIMVQMISLQNYRKVWPMMVDTTAKTAEYAMGMEGVDRVSEEIVLELVAVEEAFNVEAQVRVELEVIVVEVVNWAEEEELEH